MNLIGVLHLLCEQRTQWNVAFDDRRFNHDVAKILVDTNAFIQQRFNDFLIVFNAAGDKSQQIVITTGDEMALNKLVVFAPETTDNPS